MGSTRLRESDEDDLHILWPLCRFRDGKECLRFIQESYPTGTLKLKMQYLIEEIALSRLASRPGLSNVCSGVRYALKGANHDAASN